MDMKPPGEVSWGSVCAGLPNWLETPQMAGDQVSATHQIGSSTQTMNSRDRVLTFMHMSWQPGVSYPTQDQSKDDLRPS